MHRIPAVHCCDGGFKCGKAMRTEGVHPKAVRGEGAVGLHQRLRGVARPLPRLHGCALSRVTPEGENTALKGSPVRGVSPTLMSSTLHGLTKPSTRTVALTGFLHVHKRTASPLVRKLTRTRGQTDLAGEAGRAGVAAGLAAFAAECPWRFRVIGGLGARFPPVSAANTAAGMSAAFFAGGGAASAPLPSPSLSSYSTAASKSSPVRHARAQLHTDTRRYTELRTRLGLFNVATPTVTATPLGTLPCLSHRTMVRQPHGHVQVRLTSTGVAAATLGSIPCGTVGACGGGGEGRQGASDGSQRVASTLPHAQRHSQQQNGNHRMEHTRSDSERDEGRPACGGGARAGGVKSPR